MDAMRFADCILVSEKSALTLSIENCVPRSESEGDLVKSSNVVIALATATWKSSWALEGVSRLGGYTY